MSELPTWFNGTLILSLFAGFSSLCVGCLACVLKSRCTKIKCCGFEVERDVIKASDFKNVNISVPSGMPSSINN